jgi:hypothetical protein
MTFFNFITDNQKKQFLEDARQSLAIELAQILIRSGIDPDTFDMNSFDPESFEGFGETALRIAQIRDGINLTNEKLLALG